VHGVPYCVLECGIIVRPNKYAMCIVRVILRQLLALPCKLLSRTSAADIVKHTLHSRRVMSEEEGDVSVTRADLEKLISAISAIEGKVLNLTRELAEEREAANERLAKRMKLDKAPTFKKKAHDKQYFCNETVKVKEEAQTALNQSTPALEKAKSALTEGEKLIHGR